MVRGAAVSLGFRIAGSAAGFAFNILVARTLGMSEAGAFFLVLSILNILAMVGRFGTDVVAIRQVAVTHVNGNHALMRGTVAIALLIAVTGSLSLAIAAWIFSPFIGQVIFGDTQLIALINLAAFAVLPLAIQKVFSDILLVAGNAGLSQCIQNFLPSALNCIFFWAAAYLFGERGSIFAIVLATTLVALVAGGSWWSKSTRRTGPVEFPDVWKFLHSCWGALGVTVAGLGISSLSPVILGMYSGKEDIAVFTVASRFAMIAGLILLSVQNASMSGFAVAFSDSDRKSLEKYSFHSARLSFWLCTLCMVPCILLAAPLMSLFGDGYRSGASVLVVLCFGQIVASVCGPVNALLLMTGNEVVARNYAWLMVVLGIIFHIALIPEFGALGAAIASSLAFAGTTFVFSALVKKKLGFWPTTWLIR